jgi:ubiquinol-cytochrome c reductase cytochrome c subunit
MTALTDGRTARGAGRAIGRGGKLLLILTAVGLAAVPVGPLPAVAAPSPAPSPATTFPSPSSTPPSTSPSASTRTVGPGLELYRQSCASCHGPAGQGTQRGPSLVGVGAADVDFQLSTGRMPLVKAAQEPMHKPPVFSDAQMRDIVAYVSGLGPGGPPIPGVRAGSLTAGRDIYLAECAACHSATGAGATLTNAWVAPSLDQATPIQVAEAVRVGPGQMPAFPPNVLTDDQVDAVAGYVQQLRGNRLDRGGASLGRFGPATEGLVAWLIGLTLLVLVIRWLGSRAAE